jgi:hypothetical protein
MKCSTCGGASSRWLQTRAGTFLLCDTCEPSPLSIARAALLRLLKFWITPVRVAPSRRPLPPLPRKIPLDKNPRFDEPAAQGGQMTSAPNTEGGRTVQGGGPPGEYGRRTIVVVDRGPDAVYVGRAGQGEDGDFGNPYKVGERCPRCRLLHATPYSTLGCFALYFKERIDHDSNFRTRVLALAGRKLWCPGRCLVRGSSCHASIIADWVNVTMGVVATLRKLPPLPKRAVVAPQPRKLPPLAPSRPSKNTVVCVIDNTYAENEREFDQECVVAECSACGHQEQSWGHGDKSVRRCLVLMGQNCPEGRSDNFYILESDNA